MSTQTLNIERNPFQQNVERCLSPQSVHKRLVTDIESFLLKRKQLIFLEGCSGSGKTSLLNNLINNFDRKTHHVYLRSDELTKVTSEANSDNEGDFDTGESALDLIKDFILEQSYLSSQVVLIIDDVKSFSREIVQSLDEMLSAESSQTNNITLILSGDSENLAVLQHEYSSVLRQYSVAYTRLDNLTTIDIQQYIAEHLENAGIDADQEFPISLCEKIYNFSKGDLRKTHLILHEAFNISLHEDADEISANVLDEAASRLNPDSQNVQSSASRLIVDAKSIVEPLSSNDNTIDSTGYVQNILIEDDATTYNDRHEVSKNVLVRAADAYRHEHDQETENLELIGDFADQETIKQSGLEPIIGQRSSSGNQINSPYEQESYLKSNGPLSSPFTARGNKQFNPREIYISELKSEPEISQKATPHTRKLLPATAFFAVGLLFGILIISLLTDIPDILFTADTAADAVQPSAGSQNYDVQTTAETDGNSHPKDPSGLASNDDDQGQLPANNPDSGFISSGIATLDSDNADDHVDNSVSDTKGIIESESVLSDSTNTEITNFASLTESDNLSSPIDTANTLSQDNAKKLEALFAKANKQSKAKHLTTPKGNNAYDSYAEALSLDPGNQEALEGIKQLKLRYIQWADHAVKNGNAKDAGFFYGKALSIAPDDKELAAFIDRFNNPKNTAGVTSNISAQRSETTQASASDITKLFDAISTGDINTVGKLLQDRTLVNTRQSASGLTPLISASIHGQRPIIKLLLDNNASINMADNLGNTALMWAIEKEWFDSSRYLIQRGANIEAVNQSGGTALHYASWDGNLSMAQLLINTGANVNKKNDAGTTPLMQSVINGHAEVVKLLLQHNADSNIMNNNKWTALMYAARGGYDDITKLLLAASANTEIKNNNKMNAEEIAGTLGHNKIVAMLKNTSAADVR